MQGLANNDLLLSFELELASCYESCSVMLCALGGAIGQRLHDLPASVVPDTSIWQQFDNAAW